MLHIFSFALVGFILIVALKHCWQDMQQYKKEWVVVFTWLREHATVSHNKYFAYLVPFTKSMPPNHNMRQWCPILTHTEGTLLVPSKAMFTLKEVFLGSLVTHGRCSVANSFRLLASDPFQFSTYSDILALYNLSANSAIQQSTNASMLAICGIAS